MSTPKFTIPGLTDAEGEKLASILQERLHALNDLALTLKHVHWNVVGPHFIAVHEMLDPQVDAVRLMVDAIAERIATLGVAPVGTPGELVTFVMGVLLPSRLVQRWHARSCSARP